MRLNKHSTPSASADANGLNTESTKVSNGEGKGRITIKEESRQKRLSQGHIQVHDPQWLWPFIICNHAYEHSEPLPARRSNLDLAHIYHSPTSPLPVLCSQSCPSHTLRCDPHFSLSRSPPWDVLWFYEFVSTSHTHRATASCISSVLGVVLSNTLRGQESEMPIERGSV